MWKKERKYYLIIQSLSISLVLVLGVCRILLSENSFLSVHSFDRHWWRWILSDFFFSFCVILDFCHTVCISREKNLTWSYIPLEKKIMIIWVNWSLKFKVYIIHCLIDKLNTACIIAGNKKNILPVTVFIVWLHGYIIIGLCWNNQRCKKKKNSFCGT